MIFGIFPEFAENATPHESIINSSQIEGRALGTATKKLSIPHENDDVKLTYFCAILDSFWEAFGMSLGAKRRSKIDILKEEFHNDGHFRTCLARLGMILAVKPQCSRRKPEIDGRTHLQSLRSENTFFWWASRKRAKKNDETCSSQKAFKN